MKLKSNSALKNPAREGAGLGRLDRPEGPDVFDRSTLQRVGPALRQMCGATRCRGITGDPRGDVAALILGPVFVIIYLAVIRMTLEFYLSVVRMSEDIHKRLPQA